MKTSLGKDVPPEKKVRIQTLLLYPRTNRTRMLFSILTTRVSLSLVVRKRQTDRSIPSDPLFLTNPSKKPFKKVKDQRNSSCSWSKEHPSSKPNPHKGVIMSIDINVISYSTSV
ncbi:hypothetical protein GEMRC1_000558 [Eukaryota sp. GEM-RC1]